jgi:NADH-quinone oxidoreductase subunit B
MPRPEAVIAGFQKLQAKIARGDADNGTRYKENLEWYRANQKKIIKNWRMPDYNW